MRAVTSSLNITEYYEDSRGIYPCRCGEVHRGDYAAYDYYHHNCFHNEPLIEMLRFRQVMCPLCGEVFDLEEVKGGRIG